MKKVETYKIKGWKETETGLLVAENKEWVLVKHIPGDYVVDGYKLYKKKFIKKRSSKSEENKIKKVLQLKKIKSKKPSKFKFRSTANMLRFMEKNYGLFEFQDNVENELFYGKISKIKKGKLTIDMIGTDGKIEKKYDFKFSLNKIRSITFKTDYFESIRLLMKKQNK